MADDLKARLGLPFLEGVEEVTLPVWAIELMGEARDRIEALERERDMAAEGWAEATRLIDLARQQYGNEKSRAEAAEAALATARAALRRIADREVHEMSMPDVARKALALIDGGRT